MKTLLLQSANFKRDYVAALAIVLFFAIVAAEITLAIAIPSYLRREDAMALEVRRLKMQESFDNARRRCNNIKPKTGSLAEMELRLLSWNLDRLAPYMREESNNLTGDEIAGIQEAINHNLQVLTILGGYEKQLPGGRKIRVPGTALSEEKTLDVIKYVPNLLPR